VAISSDSGLSWSSIRKKVNQLALLDGEWAGAPMPVHDLPLVIEPRYPYSDLNGFCLSGKEVAERELVDPKTDKIRVINSWFSHKTCSRVYICEYGPGTPRFGVKLPEFGADRLDLWINTLGASVAWSMDAEITALEKLDTLIESHTYKHYILTGSFLETSKRSHVTYLFRKLRPTVALTRDRDNNVNYLTSLCLHPIGYYKYSWAGCMTPTDDVIASLLLMRADEHYFWRKANHHPYWSAAAGI
jgi:hypothetical protein